MKKFLVLILLFTMHAHAQKQNYYVSFLTGNDAADGKTNCTPWKTVAKVNASAYLPGDSVLFRCGEMWREQLEPSSSGTAAAPITFASYGIGAKPIFNGADIKTCWKQTGTNVWGNTSTNYVSARAMVIVNNVVFEEVASMAELTTKKYFINTASTPDSVFIYSLLNPNEVITELSKRDFGIYCSPQKMIHHVNFTNLEARYAGGGGLVLDGNGSDFNGSCVVDRCTFYANRQWGCMTRDKHNGDVFKRSIASFNGNGFYAWISDNNTVTTCSTNNSIHYKGGGQTFTDGGAIQNFKGKNWLVEYCYSDRDNDAIHIDAGGVSANAIIRYNKVFNSKKGSPNTPGMGVGSLGAGAVIQIYYNLIVNSASAGFESYTPSQGQVLFFNNTVYDAAGYSLEASIVTSHATNFVYKNNIIARTGNDFRPLFLWIAANTGKSDYNLFYQASGSLYRWFSSGTNYTTLPAWQAGTGNDLNSVTGNPLFFNPAGTSGDYRLQSGSPAIDKGINLGLTRDITGKLITGVPDLGCYEK